MVDVWYYKVDGLEYGPVTFDTLFHLAHGQAIQPESEVRQGDEGEWVLASSIVGLIAETSGDGIEAVPPTNKPPEDDVAFPMSPVTIPTTASDAQFFWRTFGQEFGPVPFEKFREMIQREELSASDDIRIEAPEGWLAFAVLKDIAASIQPAAPAAPSVPEGEFSLQPGFDQPEAADPFADMADQAGLESVGAGDIFDEVMSSPAPQQSQPQPAANSTAPPPQVSEPSAGKAESSPPAAAPQPVVAAKKTKPQPVAPTPAAYTPPAPKPTPSLPKPQKPKRSGPLIDWGSLMPSVEMSPKVLGILGVLLVVALYMFVPWGSGTDSSEYEVLVKIQQDFRQLRLKRGSPADWKVFEERVRSQTEPLIESLNKRASAKNKIPQYLLFAARDHLPAMLQSAREKPNDEESQFDEHLEIVRKLMAGDEIAPLQPKGEGAAGDVPTADI